MSSSLNSVVGNIGEFELNSEDCWASYVKRVKAFFSVNDVKPAVQTACLITLIGKDTYNLLTDLCSPDEPETKSFEALVTLVEDHLNPKSLFDAEIDAYPLMTSALPVTLITICYLLFVLKLGPKIMSKRKPFDLKNIMIAYNTIQMVLASFLAVKLSSYILKHGLIHSKCYAEHSEMRKELFAVGWIYFMLKISELTETVLFVLRKKFNQVSFLHVYHHTLMVAGTWVFLKVTPHDNMIFMGTLNSVVHVFMYAYYAMSAVPSLATFLWWKKYITTLQLVQFVAIFLHYQVQQMYCTCPPSKVVVVIVTLNNFLIIYLFGKFYVDNYRKNGGLEKKTMVQANGRLIKESRKKIKAL